MTSCRIATGVSSLSRQREAGDVASHGWRQHQREFSMPSYRLAALAACLALTTARADEVTANAAPEVVEEITVTGFRASLNAALADKRAAAGAIDSIRAEDIAKFPDS